jgi:hypothetical protein
MTEKARAESIQDSLQSMTEFTDAQVTINDNTVLDAKGSMAEGANYAIIYTSDTFRSVQRTRVPETDWNIPVLLVVVFETWEQAFTALRDLRDAVLAEFNSMSESNRTSDGAYISEIRSEGNIQAIYDSFVDFENEQVPDFLGQRIVFITEEY